MTGSVRTSARILLWACALAMLCAAPATAQNAEALRARHAALEAKLADNQFHRPLYLESSEGAAELRGDIYVAVDHSYNVVLTSLRHADNWCDILILHLNVKFCDSAPDGSRLTLALGRKYDQPVGSAHRMEFNFAVGAATADYLRVVLTADTGPLGTKNYRIVLESTSLDSRRTFLHMSYAYEYGMPARLAMQAYLGTLGRNKVGFTIVRQRASEGPMYIDGLRGVIERNTMRYYLAIEAYLDALNLPAAEQTEKRLSDWYAAVEMYRAQLHELDRDEYLQMKRREVRRQSRSRGEASAASVPR